MRVYSPRGAALALAADALPLATAATAATAGIATDAGRGVWECARGYASSRRARDSWTG